MPCVRMPLSLLALLVALAGCAATIPFEKHRYVGDWWGETAHLAFSPYGHVRYEQFKGHASRAVEGPLKGFKGDYFVVGVGPVATTIVVNKAPYQEGDDWKMVVDGKVLIRTPDGSP